MMKLTHERKPYDVEIKIAFDSMKKKLKNTINKFKVDFESQLEDKKY